jgi:hypothetical protein
MLPEIPSFLRALPHYDQSRNGKPELPHGVAAWQIIRSHTFQTFILLLYYTFFDECVQDDKLHIKMTVVP